MIVFCSSGSVVEAWTDFHPIQVSEFFSLWRKRPYYFEWVQAPQKRISGMGTQADMNESVDRASKAVPSYGSKIRS